MKIHHWVHCIIISLSLSGCSKIDPKREYLCRDTLAKNYIKTPVNANLYIDSTQINQGCDSTVYINVCEHNNLKKQFYLRYIKEDSLFKQSLNANLSSLEREKLIISHADETFQRCVEQWIEDSLHLAETHASKPVMDKPVIYLYPKEITDITVALQYQGNIIASYPDYNKETKGWNVTAFPDGKIIDKADKQEYSYLFWEGVPNKTISWDLKNGFVVKGSETKSFLQNILPKTGLTPKEYNEFVVYWYPILQQNPYNLIHFAQKQYTDTAPLHINPKPDALLRVFLVYKPLQQPIRNIEPQIFEPFQRKGFTVVEWGGCKADNNVLF